MEGFRPPSELLVFLSSICEAQHIAHQVLAKALDEVVGSAEGAARAQASALACTQRLEALKVERIDWTQVAPVTSHLINVTLKSLSSPDASGGVRTELTTMKEREEQAVFKGMKETIFNEKIAKDIALEEVIRDHCDQVIKNEQATEASISRLENCKHIFAFTEDVLAFFKAASSEVEEDQENVLPGDMFETANEGELSGRSIVAQIRRDFPILVSACQKAQLTFDAEMTALDRSDLVLEKPRPQNVSPVPIRNLSPQQESPSGLLNYGDCPSVMKRDSNSQAPRLTLGGLSPITQTEFGGDSPIRTRQSSLSPLNVPIRDRLRGRLTLDARKVFEEERALAMLDGMGRSSSPAVVANRPAKPTLDLKAVSASRETEPIADNSLDYSFRGKPLTARFGDNWRSEAELTTTTVPKEASLAAGPPNFKRRMSLTAKARQSIAALDTGFLLD